MSPYSLLATTVRISAADIFVSASPRHQARINVDVPLGVSRGTRKRRKSRFYWVSCRFQLGKTLRLEQGDWVKSSDFPTHGRDWEARRYSDFDISPNRRARDTDYPVNDDNSVMKVANFNGVGGGTILYTAHFPRMHPSDFRVRTLDGVADDWPIDYWTLEPYFAENDRMMGVAGLAGDPGLSRARAPHAAGTAGQVWNALRARDERARLALVAVRHFRRHHRLRWTRQVHQPRPLHAGLRQGAKASTDITYWPRALRAGVELRRRCRVREITTNEHGMASGAIYYDPTGWSSSSRPRS